MDLWIRVSQILSAMSPVIVGRSSTVTVSVHTHHKHFTQHSQELNRFNGMSVDLAVVGTAQSVIEQDIGSTF